MHVRPSPGRLVEMEFWNPKGAGWKPAPQGYEAPPSTDYEHSPFCIPVHGERLADP